MLNARSDWEIQRESSTGHEAIAAAAEFHPDVVIMGIAMKDMDGLEVIRKIRKTTPTPEILILSVHESEQIVLDALAAGAHGYVMKTNASDDLLRAVDSLRQHKVYFDSNVAGILLRAFLSYRAQIQKKARDQGQLSLRERAILKFIAEGQSNKEVAVRLNISVKTVETHRARLMAKLGVHSVSELVLYAVRNRVI